MQEIASEMLAAKNHADVERWSNLVSLAPVSDVYYLPAYAQAASEIEHSEPVAIVAGPASSRFLAPLLMRRMSVMVNGSKIEWTDASSPYGYGGLLSLSSDQLPNAGDLRHFMDDLHNWCASRGIVCCVLRLHPLMRQDEWFTPEKLLRAQFRGQTTAIDIGRWEEAADRPPGMRKGRRSDLKLARRTLRVTWTDGDDRDGKSHLDRFFALYEETMVSHRADDFYRFPRSYFSSLTSLGRRFGIAFAWLDNQLAAASLFLAGREFAHYHLAASNEVGMEHGAATLLIVEGARWARERGCKLLHLGGGVNPGDSLEDFKYSFGGELYRYASLVSIIDPERFQQLSRMPNAPWPYRLNET